MKMYACMIYDMSIHMKLCKFFIQQQFSEVIYKILIYILVKALLLLLYKINSLTGK